MDLFTEIVDLFTEIVDLFPIRTPRGYGPAVTRVQWIYLAVQLHHCDEKRWLICSLCSPKVRHTLYLKLRGSICIRRYVTVVQPDNFLPVTNNDLHYLGSCGFLSYTCPKHRGSLRNNEINYQIIEDVKSFSCFRKYTTIRKLHTLQKKMDYFST